MTAWRQLPSSRAPRPAGPHPALEVAIPLALALLLVALGHPVIAGVVVVATTVLAVVRAVRPSAAARVARLAGRFGHAVAAGLSWLLLGLVAVVILAPAAALLRLLRRDPLGTHDGSWLRARARLSARRSFGPEHVTRRVPGRAGRWVTTGVRVVGAVTAVLALNYALGWAYDEYVGSHDTPAETQAGSDLADLARSPELADEPWADQYATELETLPTEPTPFLLTRVADVDGDLIGSTDGARHGWAPGRPATAEVWVVGGGAAWGVGQRDDHTIPSALARLADQEGRPIDVVNLAQPGDTTWQAALRFEQELAVRPAPDVVVLYGGADDLAVQVEGSSPAPSHYNARGVGVALTGRDSAADQARELWEEYRETSLLTRLTQGIGGILGAQPALADDDRAARLVDLYDRSLAVVEGLAARHGVEVVAAWQAADGVAGDGGDYRRAEVGDRVVDLRSVLDGVADDVYLDGVHTDEDGARLVAAALWPAVEARLAGR